MVVTFWCICCWWILRGWPDVKPSLLESVVTLEVLGFSLVLVDETVFGILLALMLHLVAWCLCAKQLCVEMCKDWGL